MGNVVLNINMDAKCVECGKGGATGCGLCLKCCTKAMDMHRVMKTPQGRALQTRYNDVLFKKRSSGDKQP